MARIDPIDPETATGLAKARLDIVKEKLGIVPNMHRAMAHAPAVLIGYLHLSEALAHATIPARVREQIALAVAQANGCDYCLAAHSAVGRMAGLTAEEVRDARLGTAVDSRADTLVRFARRLVDTRGRVTDADLAAVRAAGWDDATIAEVIANVALHVFTNYFNIAAGTDLDFPAGAPLLAEPAGA